MQNKNYGEIKKYRPT